MIIIYFLKILTIILIASTISCKSNINTQISGKIIGTKNTWVKVRKWDFDPMKQTVIDSFYLKDEDFNIAIPIESGLCIDFYIERLGKATRYVFLQRGESVKLTGNVDIFSSLFSNSEIDLKAVGSETQNLLVDLEMRIEKASDKMEAFKEILQQNPNSLLSPVIILITDGNEPFFELLSGRVKESYYGRRVEEKIKKLENNKTGKVIPNFSFLDINGREVSIDSLAFKYLIIDFWASWCKPCRQDNPTFRKLYTKYNKYGLEILSISLDQQDSLSWLNAIKKDSIHEWIHVLDNAKNNNLADLFYVKTIPTKLIINSDRILIKRISNKSDELSEAVDELFNE